MCSTMTSVPSTMMPKSSAPRLNRLAGIPVKCMQINANSSESGMVIGRQQRGPHAAEKKNSTIRTMTSPRRAYADTVCSVLSTRSVRS